MRAWVLAALLALPAWAQPGLPEPGGPDRTGYGVVYQTDFSHGLDPGLGRQAPGPESLAVVAKPQGQGRCLRVTLSRSDIADGAPRAEISFAERAQLRQGVEYLISWSTYLPSDYQADMQQPEGITQIHQGRPDGSPPFSLTLAEGQYVVDLRNGEQAEHTRMGRFEPDRDRWIQWELHYRADFLGRQAILELYKDGSLVLSRNGLPNAELEDDQAYLKLGISKRWWPTEVQRRVLYFGDVTIQSR